MRQNKLSIKDLENELKEKEEEFEDLKMNYHQFILDSEGKQLELSEKLKKLQAVEVNFTNENDVDKLIEFKRNLDEFSN